MGPENRAMLKTCCFRRAGRGGGPVLSVVGNEGSAESGFLVAGIVRDGARRMLAAAAEGVAA